MTHRNTPPPQTRFRTTEYGDLVEVSGDVEGWHTVVHIVDQGGRQVIAEVRVIPAKTTLGQPLRTGDWDPELDPLPDGGITAAVMKQVRPYRAVQAFSKVLARMEPGTLGPVRSYKKRPGRPADPDCKLAWIGQQYIAVLGKGSRSPVVDLARRADGLTSDAPHNPRHYERIRRQLGVARNRSLMSPPPAQGVPGGALTATGVAALKTCTHQHTL